MNGGTRLFPRLPLSFPSFFLFPPFPLLPSRSPSPPFPLPFWPFYAPIRRLLRVLGRQLLLIAHLRLSLNLLPAPGAPLTAPRPSLPPSLPPVLPLPLVEGGQEESVDEDVGVPADGGGEVRVVGDVQGEMPPEEWREGGREKK